MDQVTDTAAMMADSIAGTGRETPTVAEHEAAKRQPNGFIYRIDPGYDPAGAVPPQAVQGAWPVDARGAISGAFQRNKNYNGAGGD